MSRSISKTTSQTLVVNNDRFSNLSQHERIHGFCSSAWFVCFLGLTFNRHGWHYKTTGKSIGNTQITALVNKIHRVSPFPTVSSELQLHCRYYLSLSLRLSLSVLQFRVCVCVLSEECMIRSPCVRVVRVCVYEHHLSCLPWRSDRQTHITCPILAFLSFILKADRIVTITVH